MGSSTDSCFLASYSTRFCSGYTLPLLLATWLAVSAIPSPLAAQESVQAWVELNIDVGEDIISVPGFDLGSGWQASYRQSGYWTFSKVGTGRDAQVSLYASALRNPEVSVPSVAHVRGSGYEICYDGNADRWHTQYGSPVEVSPGSLSATNNDERVTLWYSVPTVWMRHPGHYPESSECYTDDAHRTEVRLHTGTLEDAGAEVNRYGEFLLSTLHWDDIVDAAQDRTPPLTFNAIYEASDDYGEVRFRIRGSIQTLSVRFEGPSFTTEGSQSREFTVTNPPADQVESYRWEITWPEGAGHTPEAVQFTAPNERSTTIEQAKWYALPDSRWQRDTPELASTYQITAYVTVDGTEYQSLPRSWTVEVINSGEILERPPWHRSHITIEIEQSEVDDLWYVTGQGRFRRIDTYTPIVYTPVTSDFFVKTEAHENHHVLQATTLEPGVSMWDVDTFFREVLVELPGQYTWFEMFDLAMVNRRLWEEEDLEHFEANRCRMEADAFEAEYGLGPEYLEWEPSDVPRRYNCSF